MPRSSIRTAALLVVLAAAFDASAVPPKKAPPRKGGAQQQSADSPQQQSDASLPPRVRQRKERFARDTCMTLHTGEKGQITVKGVTIDTHGATAEQRDLMVKTLEKLPKSHITAIPRIVVGDTAGHGAIHSGGNSINQATVDRLNAGGIYKQMAEAGFPEKARLELTHESFRKSRRGVWGTLFHETGHFVDAKFHLTRKIKSADMGELRYTGKHQTGDPKGPLMERLADAYSGHWQGTLRDRVAAATIKRLMDGIPQE